MDTDSPGPAKRARLRAVGHVAPLVTMLMRTVYDPVVADSLPETLALPRERDGKGVPLEAVYEARSAG